MDPYDACLEEQEKDGEFIFKIENIDIKTLDNQSQISINNINNANNTNNKANNTNNNANSNNKLNMGNKLSDNINIMKEKMFPILKHNQREIDHKSEEIKFRSLSTETQKAVKLIKENTVLANVNTINVITYLRKC